MAWQRFVFANLFGFVERGSTTRRFRQAVVFVPRGNGKTTLAAPIGLYLTFDPAGEVSEWLGGGPVVRSGTAW
jgi:phage terminase large subunit-like protein